jgi:hypothetical protein
LYVQFSTEIKEAQVSYENPDHCASNLKINKGAGRLELIHTGGPCPSGLKIKAVIPLKQSVEIVHGGGFISVEKTAQLTEATSSIDAYTQGLVTTEVDSINLVGRYAPNSAHYENDNKNLPGVIIRLTGGVIQFQR